MMAAAALIAASATVAGATGKPVMRLTGPAAPPIGHVQFCAEYPEECLPQRRPDQVVRLTEAVWTRLDALNRAVNAAVAPATDMEIFGTTERWTYPALVGDCEDYVLEKRRMLMRDGWPASALLITVVRDEEGEGHAVLTVRTDLGDLVLDNKTDEIVAWSDTPYLFVKRQSARDSAAWDAIEDGRAAVVGSLR